ncbi:hypothetical protein V6N11_015980 [Hibiscus sabdariffa]|uniref:RNase H type-1 domain-containing protein n=2 Tax=Hibiscus sabdariffa TaxID=183260 RepID=A0ABR2TTX3_9ROSI
MENPKLSAEKSTGIATDSRSALLSSTVNGRPPDALSIVCSGPVLERPGSPLVDDVQRDMKKLKGPESALLADSSTPMEFDEGHSGKEGPVEIVELSPKHGHDAGKSSVSYASVVGRSLKGDEQGSDGVGLDPNKVIVLDEDCVVNRDGKFPTISTEQPPPTINSPVRPETSTESLFGPWMVVDTRRRRAFAGRSIPKGVDTEEKRGHGSRFTILGKDSGISEMEQVSDAEGDVQQSLWNVQDNPMNGRASLETLGTKKSGITNIVGGSGSVAGGNSAPKKSVAAGAVVLPLKEGRSVSVVEHAGPGMSHSAVSIVEQDHEGRGGDSIVQGKRVGGKAKGVKENVKQGLKIRRSSDVRNISRPVLSEWVDNMNNQLDNLARNRVVDPGGVIRMRVNQEGDLEKSTSLADRDQGPPRLTTDGSEGAASITFRNSDALKAISRGGADYGRLALLRYILDLCNRDWIVSFNQVSRGNNGVADRLSKIALGGDFQVKRLDEPPMEVVPFVNIVAQWLGVGRNEKGARPPVFKISKAAITCVFELKLRLATEVRRERLPKIHGQAMDGHNSEDSKQNTADMTVFVQNLLQQMQSRFQTMSDSIITKVDEMGNRINELEQSINDLKAEMGVEGSPSPLPPPNQTSDGAKQEEGSA